MLKNKTKSKTVNVFGSIKYSSSQNLLRAINAGELSLSIPSNRMEDLYRILREALSDSEDQIDAYDLVCRGLGMDGRERQAQNVIAKELGISAAQVSYYANKAIEELKRPKYKREIKALVPDDESIEELIVAKAKAEEKEARRKAKRSKNTAIGIKSLSGQLNASEAENNSLKDGLNEAKNEAEYYRRRYIVTLAYSDELQKIARSVPALEKQAEEAEMEYIARSAEMKDDGLAKLDLPPNVELVLKNYGIYTKTGLACIAIINTKILNAILGKQNTNKVVYPKLINAGLIRPK